MKKILIDARFYGPKDTGIGRYTKNLLKHLTKTKDFKKYKFLLIVNNYQVEDIKKDLGKNFHITPVNIPHYSLKEQLVLPFIINKLKPDLVHFPHFNKAIFYTKPSVVTIHDLIKHFYRGKDTTTKTSLLYWPKYLAYLLVSQIAIKTSSIIVPSNFWRDYLIKNFKVKDGNIITTHEAVDPTFLKASQKTVSKPQNYIIYTGNLYPHKNYLIIFKALKNFPKLKLKIICARSVFQERAKKMSSLMGISSQVEFLGYLEDKDFKNVYKNALALVHPSFMEGFSLTGLEAMSLNCPVISSNASCLPEIYGNSVLYFDPNKSKQLTNQLKKLQNSTKLRANLIKRGHLQVSKYSWTKTANLTMDFYKKTLHDST